MAKMNDLLLFNNRVLTIKIGDYNMAKIDPSCAGGWRGKVGAVVESSWNGIRYLKARPAHYRDCKSALQLAQRRRMTLCHQFIQKLLPIVRIGFKHQAIGQSAYNVAMSRNIRCAIQESAEGFAVNYTHAVLGEGTLAQGELASMAVGEEGACIAWKSNTASANGEGSDKALIAIFNATCGEAIFWLRHACRSDEQVLLPLPQGWAEQELHGYLGFENKQQTLCSNIVHLG